MNGSRDEDPILITEAQPSYDDQLQARRRKYLIMMAMRIPFVILAGVFWQTWWLAILMIALSVPLPWVAVLIANDRPARKSERVRHYRGGSPRELEARDHPIVEL